ncbi:hypothetical protein ACFVYE_03440 [Streptomyces sp. NPDC058239]|uniref:hypothetical protein n=1 Tax=unclassified Streptomyces TaxID=2593676 RepID=UPI0036544050
MQNQRPTRSTNDQLSVIDSLNALPFPDQEEQQRAGERWSGPGYHLAVLRESQDFWEDRSEEIVDAAEQALEGDLAVLTAVLTDRWGKPETVDLWPYLSVDSPDPDFMAPEPVGFLCCVAGSMQVWRPTAPGRWLALTIGQADPEFPLQLLAAFGEASSLPE